MKFFPKSILVLPLIFLFSACSDDDDNIAPPSGGGGGGSGDEMGSSSFVISGDYEGEYSGIANFKAFEIAGIHTWDILIQDLDPITFNISFDQQGDEPIAAPEVGTYNLGIYSGEPGEFEQPDDWFLATYSYYEDTPLQGDTYTVGIDGTSGEMEITTSSDDLVEGTFSFTAVRLEDGQVVGSIEVTEGEFSAVPRP